MTCEKINLGDGITAIVCGPRKRSKPCHYCHHAGTFLCDHPVIRQGTRHTCDTLMCADCTNKTASGVDLCRPHFNLYRNNGNKFVIGGLEISESHTES